MRRKAMVAVMLAVCANAFALEDTPKNRAKQAERYLRASPPKKVLMAQLEARSRSLPEKRRDALRKAWAEHIDWGAIRGIARESLIKHFTADELKAFVETEGVVVPPGEKHRQDAYDADVIPRIEQELLKGLERAKAKQTASRRRPRE